MVPLLFVMFFLFWSFVVISQFSLFYQSLKGRAFSAFVSARQSMASSNASLGRFEQGNGHQWICLTGGKITPWKFNIDPENLYTFPKRKCSNFQPSFFRGYVKLRGCKAHPDINDCTRISITTVIWAVIRILIGCFTQGIIIPCHYIEIRISKDPVVHQSLWATDSVQGFAHLYTCCLVEQKSLMWRTYKDLVWSNYTWAPKR